MDYYLPNQAQREQAYRDLFARDGIKAGVEDLGLPPGISSPVSVVGPMRRKYDEGGSKDGAQDGEGGGDLEDVVIKGGGEQRYDEDEVRNTGRFYCGFDKAIRPEPYMFARS